MSGSNWNTEHDQQAKWHPSQSGFKLQTPLQISYWPQDTLPLEKALVRPRKGPQPVSVSTVPVMQLWLFSVIGQGRFSHARMARLVFGSCHHSHLPCVSFPYPEYSSNLREVAGCHFRQLKAFLHCWCLVCVIISAPCWQVECSRGRAVP
jgi:hypothetical protein